MVWQGKRRRTDIKNPGSRPPTPEQLRHYEQIASEMASLREGKRYKAEGFKTWDQCCGSKWGLSRQRCSQIMAWYGP